MGYIKERLDMSGKVAVVTGAGQGIGRAIAIGLADVGAQVVIGEINEETGASTEQAIRDAGGEALFVHTDVRQVEQIQALVARAREHFGRIDVMANNAGGNFQLPALEISERGFEAIIRMNTRSMFFGCQAAAQAMVAEGHGGSIVNTASVAGLQGSSHGIAVYAGAKAGIMGLTRALAAEWGPHGIRVNVVAPGSVDTEGARRNMQQDFGASASERVPLQRRAQPEDIAAAVVFLASDLADYVTGQTIPVDGGSSTSQSS